MNGNLASVRSLCGDLARFELSGVKLGLCLPSVYLMNASQQGVGGLLIGAQNCYGEDRGAFTGEISVYMLREAGVELCLAGHSERRQLFGESDELVKAKLMAILSGGLWGVLCVGENLAERQAGQHFEVVQRQLRVLEGLEYNKLLIAYEPVWAIGSVNATSEQVGEMHKCIHRWLVGQWGAEVAGSIQILYGGSVKGDNASTFFAEPHVAGVLVGGASLTADSFLPIIKAASLAEKA